MLQFMFLDENETQFHGRADGTVPQRQLTTTTIPLTGSDEPYGSCAVPNVRTPFVPIVIILSVVPNQLKSNGNVTWYQPSSLFCSHIPLSIRVPEESAAAAAAGAMAVRPNDNETPVQSQQHQRKTSYGGK